MQKKALERHDMVYGKLYSIKINGVEIFRRETDTSSTKTASVLGGSIDGAEIPAGTRHGQRLVWDAKRKRWIG